jgi:hypothetical protein
MHSCKLNSVEPESIDLGYDYYPLEVGRYVIYDAYDTLYDPAQPKRIDTMYQVKEVIHDSFKDGTEEKFVVYHFTKRNTDIDFPAQPDSVWTVVNTANQLIRTESNVAYIKLVFPVKEGKTWNGNAKNTSGPVTSSDKFYNMTNLDKPYTISNIVYPRTLKLTIANQSDPIVSKDIRYDIYVRGIGFAKKDYTVYYYKQASNVPPQTIDYGSHKVMLMTSYGKE